jgi:two-component system OmpR family sensor kinase
MTLSRRISLMVLVVIAFTSISIAVLSAVAGRASAITQVDERLASLRDAVRVEEDPLQALLAGLIAPPRNFVAALVSQDEEPLDLLADEVSGATTIAPLSAEQLSNAASSPITVGDDPIRLVTIDLGNEQWLVIGESISEISDAFGRQLFVSSMIAIVVSLLGGAVASVVTRRSLQPLRDIVEYSGSIAAGRLDAVLPTDASTREIRELQQTIGSTVGALQNAAETKSRSESAMREFLADVAHELRTPLTTVRAYSEILAVERPADPEVRERAMNRIADESKRMSKLIDDLLLLARVSAAPSSSRERVDVGRVAMSHFNDLAILDPGRKITLECDESWVLADVALMDRLFANLASNVHRHTPSTAAVMVRCEVDGASIICSVDDSGPGIDAMRLAKLAEGTQRFDPLRSDDVRGSGLGLHLVTSIARAHGGSASFERSPLGGLRVIVRLPMQPAGSR